MQRSTYNGNLSMTFNPLRFVVAAPTIPKPHEQQVAEAAYFIALKRGFEPGYEAQDWAAAEKELAEAKFQTTSHE